MPSSPDAWADRFDLLVRLGAGASSEVWRARDRRLRRDVALKQVHADSPDALRQLRRDFRLAMDVRDPCVARVHEIGQLAGRLAVVSELVDGEPLELRLGDDHDLKALARGLARGRRGRRPAWRAPRAPGGTRSPR